MFYPNFDLFANMYNLLAMIVHFTACLLNKTIKHWKANWSKNTPLCLKIGWALYVNKLNY